MKKALSVILAVVLMFSTVSVLAFAEDETAEEPIVTVEFYWDAADIGGEPKNTVTVVPGENLVEYFGYYGYPETPVKEATEKVEYTFKYWELYTEKDDGTWSGTGVYRNSGNLDPVPEDAKDGTKIVYVAVFYEEEIPEVMSFWALIASIFARFNMIFEYFAKVFEGVFDF